MFCYPRLFPICKTQKGVMVICRIDVHYYNAFFFQLTTVKISTTYYFVTNEQKTATFLFNVYNSYSQAKYDGQINTI